VGSCYLGLGDFESFVFEKSELLNFEFKNLFLNSNFFNTRIISFSFFNRTDRDSGTLSDRFRDIGRI
jgi:hypothetical protein